MESPLKGPWAVAPSTSPLERYQNPPINRLPPELIVEVFRRAVLSSKSTRAPIVLSSITSHLRSIAIRAPVLWSTIVIKVGTNALHQIPNLELRLARSRTSVLHVSMVFEHKDSYRASPTQSVAFFRRLLHNVVYRAATLDVSILDPSCMALLSTIDISAPSLVAFRISTPSTLIPSPFLPLGLPPFRHVNIAGLGHRGIADMLSQCAPLQTLKLQIDDRDDPLSTSESTTLMESIFRQHSSTLVSLVLISRGEHPYGFDAPRGSITFLHLRNLMCSVLGASILDPIYAPSLRAFVMDPDVERLRHQVWQDGDQVVVMKSHTAYYHFACRQMTSLESYMPYIIPYDLDATETDVFPHLRKLVLTPSDLYATNLYDMISPVLEYLSIDMGGLPVPIAHHPRNPMYGFKPLAPDEVLDTNTLSLPSLVNYTSLGADCVLLRVTSAPQLRKMVLSDPCCASFTKRPFGYCIENIATSPFLEDMVLELPSLVSFTPQYESPILSLISAPRLRDVLIPGSDARGGLASFLSNHPSIVSLATIPEFQVNFPRDLDYHPIPLPNLLSLTIQGSYHMVSSIAIQLTRLELDLGRMSDPWVLNEPLGVQNLLTAMARTSTRDSTGTWLFPCATEVELCFVDPPKEWWHYDDEPSTGAAFDLQVLQRMIAARRKARNGVVQVERLTIQNHSQTWDPSTLSPELITWFTVNVPTFVFKGTPPSPPTPNLNPFDVDYVDLL